LRPNLRPNLRASFAEYKRAIRLEDEPYWGQTTAVSETADYPIPESGLGLKGPVSRPELGTLPIRGDLAHIALAQRYLVPHYVVPHVFHVGDTNTPLRCAADEESETVAELSAGSRFEVLDLAGDWYWGCIGPEGPTGYVAKGALAAPDNSQDA